MPELLGRRIILTGGAQGIGAGLVKALVGEGASVATLDVLEQEGTAVVAEASALGPGNATFLRCDVSNRAEVFASFGTAVDQLGGLDVLVHVAAVSRPKNAEDISEEEWDGVLDINLKGTLFTNQAAFPYLKEAGGGRIMNFASTAGLVAYARQRHYNASYAASKAAVLGFVRAIAYEWGKYGITVNAICPQMMTPMLEAARSRRSPEELAKWEDELHEKMAIDGRPGQTERDLAPFVVFMAGEGSRFITGQTLIVDGGKTLSR